MNPDRQLSWRNPFNCHTTIATTTTTTMLLRLQLLLLLQLQWTIPCEEMKIHHMWMVQVVSVRSTTTRKKCSSNAAVCRLTNPSRFDWLMRSADSRREPVMSCSWNMWISSMFRQSCHTTPQTLGHYADHIPTILNYHTCWKPGTCGLCSNNPVTKH